MQTKLASVLTVLSVALTAIAVAVFAVGPFAAVAIALISGLALLAWLLVGSPTDEVSDGVVAPYVFSIPLLVALETIRYVSGWVELLQTNYKPLFAARFAITDVNWFVALCASRSVSCCSVATSSAGASTSATTWRGGEPFSLSPRARLSSRWASWPEGHSRSPRQRDLSQPWL